MVTRLFYQINYSHENLQPCFLLLFQFPLASQSITSSPMADSVQVLTDSVQILNVNKPRLVNSVYKSADGGQTWQDISEGLSEAGQQDGIQRDDFFADDKRILSGCWKLDISQ